jgi:signal transduction histidine kinase
LEKKASIAKNKVKEAVICNSIGFLLAAIATAIVINSPLPRFILPGQIISRPVDFIVAVIYLVAFFLFVRVYHDKEHHTPFMWCMTGSIIFGFATQVYMVHSQQLYDAQFDMSHVVKIFSYIFPIFGITVGTFTMYKKEEKLAGEIQIKNRKLGERVKEIGCLYELSRLVEKPDISLDAIFQEMMSLIPPAWQYPEITRAKICFDGAEYISEPFEETQWKLASDITVSGKRLGSVEVYYTDERPVLSGKRLGSVEVYYTEERPVLDEGPFLKEERELIDAIARTLSEVAEREQAAQTTKLAYEKLKEANKELKETQSQLVQNEKLASIGQLAAGIAHEINTPVGFVASNFQTLESYIDKIEELLKMYDKLIVEIEASGKTELLNQTHAIAKSRGDMKIDFILEDIQELFADSKEGVARVTNIVRSLRDFSRIDLPGSLDEYNINDGIESTLVVAKNEIKYDANVKTDFSEVPSILCLAGQINQVFLNVFINAAQAIKSRHGNDMGTITIKTYATDDQVVCEISDNGCGIAPENLSKVFDPFFTTKPTGKGTGLGLSVSHDIIVHKHNGELLVDSTVGEGTIFTIKIPIKNQNLTTEKEMINDGKKNGIICG